MKHLKVGIAVLCSFVSFQAFSAPEVIYGNDDRKDLYEITDPLIRQQVESTATFTLFGLIMPNSQGGYNLTDSPLGRSLNLCPEVKFRDQPSIGACSATLVAPKILLTAGHCMPDQNRCEEIYLMFGFHVNAPGEYMKTVAAKDVYRCKKLLARAQNSQQDFALIELDREVTDRKPVEIGNDEVVRRGDQVRLIGYPDGIPSKVVSGATVRSADWGKFVSNVDAFKGNSGSGIFSEKSGKLVGVLFMGNNDYVNNVGRGCREATVCRDWDCRGEDATQISNIWSTISPYLESQL
jgi:V8-like Glu-specific endopeptidase